MYGTEVIVAMLLLRLVIPASLLLWIGEVIQQHQDADFHRTSHQA